MPNSSDVHSGQDSIEREMDGEASSSDQSDQLEEPTLTVDETRDRWAVEAREMLIDTARHYQSVTTHKELAEHVQRTSGLTATQMTHLWIGDVLGRVAADSASRAEPLLSSLCVNAQGSVGDAYAVAVKAVTGDSPEDPDDHAAQQRLECHRHFGADLPAGGAFAVLTPRLAMTRDRARKNRIEAQPVALCPVHHIALPASGVCDFCD